MTAGDSAAGARPAATKPKAAISAASKAVRISDVSPMSGPLRKTAPDHCGGAWGFQQLRPFARSGVEESHEWWAFLMLPFPEPSLGEAPGKRAGAFCEGAARVG